MKNKKIHSKWLVNSEGLTKEFANNKKEYIKYINSLDKYELYFVCNLLPRVLNELIEIRIKPNVNGNTIYELFHSLQQTTKPKKPKTK